MQLGVPLGRTFNRKGIEPPFQARRLHSGHEDGGRKRRLEPRVAAGLLDEARVGGGAPRGRATQAGRHVILHSGELSAARTLGHAGPAGPQAFVASACGEGRDGGARLPKEDFNEPFHCG